ncbi:GNAT family N-acetyltransferase [Winogradskya consettensis]|uniref:AIR synthase n=1 Tax=Winogradskya consettensis TaxID=113560 RepID=A0A919SYC1_9ACTN|nr:MSMEG_0567/sll0787 family protein [Actinoplanes consettensis]GIM80956.1 AIR synthase [Actinoplanes consettensis]
MTDLVPVLLGPPTWFIEQADDLREYHRLRHRVFVEEQGLFAVSDRDDRDDDPRTVVLVARAPDGAVLGGVRIGPATDGPDLGWWAGGRLVVDPRVRGARGIGPALVRAACAYAENAGALRFDATVQRRWETMFRRIGWQHVRGTTVAGHPHTLMRWPIGRLQALATATKSVLGDLVRDLAPAGFAGDDGAPVPGSDLIAACDAILPSMVERDPEWAGWCAVLVNVNDLAAMGAEPVGLLNAVAARDAAFAGRIFRGLKRGSEAYGIPILGGHTQLGVPAALSATALGRTAQPVPGGGGLPGQSVRITADLGGSWRPGYHGRQWDSTSHRDGAELRRMTGLVAAMRPSAAKDVSMAGIAGTLGMLAEASGCGAILEVASVPRPAQASMGDWLTCFPGFAMITTGGTAVETVAVTAECGELTEGQGVRLRWPDGETTAAIDAGVTGLGRAT